MTIQKVDTKLNNQTIKQLNNPPLSFHVNPKLNKYMYICNYQFLLTFVMITFKVEWVGQFEKG
jgi:hypothetical protein